MTKVFVKESNETVRIPLTFNGRVFQDAQLHTALYKCQIAGYDALFMPQIIDTRLSSDKGSFIWQKEIWTPSICATGRTKSGRAVVVFAHVPNYFSNPENIEDAISQGLLDDAAPYPEKEFSKLLDMEDRENVYVVEHYVLRNSVSGLVNISRAINHPMMIPFIGGQERAEKYLDKHKSLVEKNTVGIWHKDDLHNCPYARLLRIENHLLGDFDSDINMGFWGRFVGIPIIGARKSFDMYAQAQISETFNLMRLEGLTDDYMKTLKVVKHRW